MNWRREAISWAGIALASVLLFVSVLVWEAQTQRSRWVTQGHVEPGAGRELFEAKGCVKCHQEPPGAGGQAGAQVVPRILAAMWNHAPEMWQRMQAEQLEYPALTADESGKLLSYLFMESHADPPGDAAAGQQLFRAKKCERCHASPPARSPATLVSEFEWVQALWNHAARMQDQLAQRGVEWPQLRSAELRDLFVYAQKANGFAPQRHARHADPARGWRAFQEKGCSACHSTSGSTRTGPGFGAGYRLPPTYSEFAEAMLNHFPAMRKALRDQNLPMPALQHTDMADLAAFVYSLHLVDPTGSADVGQSTFEWRGCAQCHGPQGAGTASAPALRGVGKRYTAVTLTADLWKHGGSMFREHQRSQVAWPKLESDDIGPLLSFLNTAPRP